MYSPPIDKPRGSYPFTRTSAHFLSRSFSREFALCDVGESPRVRFTSIPFENRMRSCWRATGHPSVLAWARSTGLTRASSRSRGLAIARPARLRHPTRSSRSLTASTCYSTRGAGDRATGRINPRRRSHCRGEKGRGDDLLHLGTALVSLARGSSRALLYGSFASRGARRVLCFMRMALAVLQVLISLPVQPTWRLWAQPIDALPLFIRRRGLDD